MLTRHDVPILEFDDCPTAKLNPQNFVDRPFDTDRMVITFFPEVMEKLRAQGMIVPEREIGGENPFVVYRFVDEDVLIVLGFVNLVSKLFRKKEEAPTMTEEEQLQLLASDGMLVKRPVIVTEDGKVLTGFKEKEWADALL